MAQIISAFGPVFLFMSIPLWIPVIAITLGAISDRRPARRSRGDA